MLRKLMIGTVTFGVALAGLFIAPAHATEAGVLCIQGAGSVIYQLQFGSAGDDLAIGGVRISPSVHNVPISGSAYINNQGVIVIGFNELLDYGSGVWSEPLGTTVLRLSGGTVSYDTTYSGVGTPINVTGTGAVVACTGSVSSAAAGSSAGTDPNARTSTSPAVNTQSTPARNDPASR